MNSSALTFFWSTPFGSSLTFKNRNDLDRKKFSRKQTNNVGPTSWAQFTINDISLGTPRTALLLCFVSVDVVLIHDGNSMQPSLSVLRSIDQSINRSISLYEATSSSLAAIFCDSIFLDAMRSSLRLRASLFFIRLASAWSASCLDLSVSAFFL